MLIRATIAEMLCVCVCIYMCVQSVSADMLVRGTNRSWVESFVAQARPSGTAPDLDPPHHHHCSPTSHTHTPHAYAHGRRAVDLMWQLQWGRLSHQHPAFRRDVTANTCVLWEWACVSVCLCVCLHRNTGVGLVEGCHNEAWFGGADVGIWRASAETWKWWFIRKRISPSLFQPVCFIVFFYLYHCLSLSLSLSLVWFPVPEATDRGNSSPLCNGASLINF